VRDFPYGKNTTTATDSMRGRLVPLVLGEDCAIEEIEREHIARVVARAPSFEAAAQILGIDPTTLQRKRKRYGLA
jgi:transcriptional regulator with GAF, ATPase, and Fis domain